MKSNQSHNNTSKRDWLECDVDYLVDNNILYKPLDGNHGGIHPKSSDFVDSGIPFIMASDVSNFKIDLTTCNFISKVQADKLQKGFSIKGDVLFTHKGSVGGTAIVPAITTDYIMLTPQVTYYRVKDSNKLNNYFIFSYFQSDWFQNYVKSVSGGGTRAYIGITAQLSLPFIVPPISEQNRIVLILKTWDEVIEKLAQKIEAKKQIKKALMQDLLTGKKRLKGFSDKWETFEFNDFFEVLKKPNGYKTEEYELYGEIPIIDQSKDNLISGYINNKNKVYDFTKRNVIIFGDHSRVIKFIDTEVSFGNDGIKLFQTKDNFDVRFGYYVLLNFRVPETGYNRHFKYLDSAIFEIPKSSEEQKAIAEILTTADKEITELEKKLSILKEQKRYLLNNLITGKIRTPETLSTKLNK